MFKLLGIKLIGVAVDLNCFMFGLKFAPADECVEDEEKDVSDGDAVLFFFGPVYLVVVF